MSPPLPPRPTPAVARDPLPLTDEDEDVPDAEAEAQLSDQQVQDLYDNEEIDHFFSLFSACVTEIRIPDTPTSGNAPIVETTTPGVFSTNEPILEEGTDPDHAEKRATVDGSPDSILSERRTSGDQLCRTIVSRYLVPILPPPPVPSPVFTLGRLRVATQRLYLSIQPTYKPFFLNLARLATWQDQRRSLKFCIIFWILWYQNLLLPALIFRLLCALAYTRYFPRPALPDLRERRKEIKRANEFGEDIQDRLSSSSVLDIKEMWRVLALFNKAKKKARAKILQKDKSSLKSDDEIDDTTVLDDTKESSEEKDVKRAILQAINEIADIHERIKNIFLWRRPASSRNYGTIIAVLFLAVLLIPAQYLAKLVYFVGGIFFWHIVPLLAALPPSDRARLPPPFADVPTDADYAMELISKRIMAGLPVTPARTRKSKKAEPRPTHREADDVKGDGFLQDVGEKKVDWKKWGERAALGKAWMDDGIRLTRSNQELQESPSTSRLGFSQGRQELATEPHTFPATHNAMPGLITVTAATFLFTPLTSPNAKFTIPLSNLRGVKKAGFIKGLSLRWSESNGDGKLEKEERFMWVGGRDELFARLLGTDGRRWLRA